MANEMTFNQIATVLNAIQTQATGVAGITPTDTASFVNCATTVLKTGYDRTMGAISQVLSRTIFSVRPYTRKFNGLERSETQWGNHIRKLKIADKDFQESDAHIWPVNIDGAPAQDPGSPVVGDGYGVDQQIINKPDMLQTNFYGRNVFQDSYTIFKDQLDVAFTGPDELARFISMVVQNMSDKLEQSRENTARAVLANFMGGLISENDPNRIVHLLTEYNALTGLSLTATTVYQPDNYAAFMKWVYSRVAAISRLMTERSELFQTVVNGKHIMQHTPFDRQKVYLFAPARYQIDARVLADTFHDNYLRYADVEAVNFWQSIESPDEISLTASRIASDGSVASATVTQGNIYGCIFDEEAMGYAVTNQSADPAPYNARGKYQNTWIHETQNCWNDHTEKGVLLLLD